MIKRIVIAVLALCAPAVAQSEYPSWTDEQWDAALARVSQLEPLTKTHFPWPFDPDLARTQHQFVREVTRICGGASVRLRHAETQWSLWVESLIADTGAKLCLHFSPWHELLESYPDWNPTDDPWFRSRCGDPRVWDLAQFEYLGEIQGRLDRAKALFTPEVILIDSECWSVLDGPDGFPHYDQVSEKDVKYINRQIATRLSIVDSMVREAWPGVMIIWEDSGYHRFMPPEDHIRRSVLGWFRSPGFPDELMHDWFCQSFGNPHMRPWALFELYEEIRRTCAWADERGVLLVAPTISWASGKQLCRSYGPCGPFIAGWSDYNIRHNWRKGRYLRVGEFNAQMPYIFVHPSRLIAYAGPEFVPHFVEYVKGWQGDGSDEDWSLFLTDYDLNGDGRVDLADVAVLAEIVGEDTGTNGQTPTTMPAEPVDDTHKLREPERPSSRPFAPG